MPLAMQERKQWLLWKLEEIPGRNGLQKVPYYLSGRKRWGTLGGPDDLRALAPFEQAVAQFRGALGYSGVAFAFIHGDGLIGIDLDWKHTPEQAMEAHHMAIMEAVPSYTEFSPSGKGGHIIVQGTCDSFKHDPIGVEVYCGDRYFACTGDKSMAELDTVEPITPTALAYLQDLVQKSKDAASAARHAARQAEAPAAAADEPLPTPAPPPVHQTQPAGQQTSDFRRVNDAAHQALAAWVPRVFDKARPWRNGYRVRSKDLGRELEEDLQLSPEGIMDFGEEQGMSPIDVVMKWLPGMAKPKDALLWLAQAIGMPLQASRPPLRSVPPAAPPPAQPDDGPAPQSPPAPSVDGAPPQAVEGAGGVLIDMQAAKSTKRKGSRRQRKAEGGDEGRVIDWDKFHRLRDNFALIYGTDTVWDGEQAMIMKIANMGHAHGSDMVKLWKGGQACWKKSEGGRWTVLPQNVVFDPTGECDADTHVNLFGGFPTEPRPGDVAPFLELIDFLCSRAGDTKAECDAIKHYLVCCMAWPLQHMGAKLRTAVVMHGDEGAGKNFLTDTLVMIYGKYGTTVGQDELEDKFNDYRSGKLILVGDEVSSRAELVHNKNRLKSLITSPTVQINPKNLPRREEANHINVWFNSNELQPLALDNSDRRYLVIYTPRAREFEFYRALGRWRAADGVAHLYHYLLQYDASDFDPFAPAPQTRAKQDLIDLNRKSPERFWIEWSSGELDLPYRSCTVPQAYSAYLKYAQRVGDRFPIQRVMFTRMVLRISDTMGQPCVEKVMKVDYSPESGDDPRATRMLLVTKPPDDIPQGVWATDCWVQFERELRRYVGRDFQAAGGSKDGGEGAP